ncbi:uncharacterized protein BDR25DRAFT_313171 [Lindgomyces ingoldianus]|uniref:Uncharacterized protein n=1 Tax=Lindgomyces ingoldianus TaxID=673940 RepID=A0ACB6QY58_9PLEO|nr:uncharacterized protein BDR25DRAFT_313171 [Lindgomyces ingoldianus]KAF2471948.1 hypothetical protein BDR25DRAFT_313171 [Lindgomyces ingoldianus]
MRPMEEVYLDIYKWEMTILKNEILLPPPYPTPPNRQSNRESNLEVTILWILAVGGLSRLRGNREGESRLGLLGVADAHGWLGLRGEARDPGWDGEAVGRLGLRGEAWELSWNGKAVGRLGPGSEAGEVGGDWQAEAWLDASRLRPGGKARELALGKSANDAGQCQRKLNGRVPAKYRSYVEAPRARRMAVNFMLTIDGYIEWTCCRR